jgi:Xaa-Pro aminopeptidase
MKDRFTRVLKGHIAIARAVFPVGTRGSQLDVLARQHLWAAGLDYAHGTGHGVGAYLSVHEGPQRIATFGGGDEPLAPGMILSDEPGYYKAGEYGIRIENLVLVEPRAIDGAEKEMLGFETLTFAPIDRNLIETALLTQDERAWVDAYHARVLALLGALVPEATGQWLAEVCRPLEGA